jgi:hypothetical protein
LSQLDPGSFAHTKLRSLCVPASVESFPKPPSVWGGFPSCFLVLIFESGWRLRRLAGAVFGHHRPFYVFLPASLAEIEPDFFPCGLPPDDPHYLPTYALAPGNRHFSVVGRTLMNAAQTSVVRYFEESLHYTVEAGIEELGPRSFSSIPLETVEFAPDTNLRFIRAQAFEDSRSFMAITIPRTVEVIGFRAFCNCGALRDLQIELGSRLRLIEEAAFDCCESLRAVDVPITTTIRAHFIIDRTLVDAVGVKRRRVEFMEDFDAYDDGTSY